MASDQYRDIMAARTLEATVGWAKNIFFAGAHGSGFYFAITQLDLGSPKLLAASLGGVIGMFLWRSSARRTRNLMSYWNDCLAAIERAHPDLYLPVFSADAFKIIERTRATGSNIFFALIWLVGISWIVLGSSIALHIRITWA